MKKVAFIVCFALFFGCNQTKTSESKENTTTVLEDTLTEFEKKVKFGKEIIPKLPTSYNIKLLEGVEKYNGVTTLTYKNLKMVVDEIEKKAKELMWADDKKQSFLDESYKDGLGGDLTLEIKRIIIEAANTKFFDVIIQDSTGKEIFRKELKSSIPDNINDMWTNTDLISIPEYIGNNFFVYVIDRASETKFKYQIKSTK